MKIVHNIRQPEVAGLFYPANIETLESDIQRLLAEAKAQASELTAASTPKFSGTVVGLISPHAGYQYSGFTAAHGYHLLRNLKVDTVVIVSPSHREYFDGISVFSGSAYRTPLGELPVDGTLHEALLINDAMIESSTRGHGPEHAIEVQLPFLQTVLTGFKILPIVMGDQRRKYCFHLGERLGTILQGKNVLMIASTDLSHYYSYEVANKLDKIVTDDIAAFDYGQLMDDLESERSEACGGGPTVAVLLAAQKLGADVVKVLHHCNSGDITGDHDRVVGYLSAAILRSK